MRPETKDSTDSREAPAIFGLRYLEREAQIVQDVVGCQGVVLTYQPCDGWDSEGG